MLAILQSKMTRTQVASPLPWMPHTLQAQVQRNPDTFQIQARRTQTELPALLLVGFFGGEREFLSLAKVLWCLPRGFEI